MAGCLSTVTSALVGDRDALNFFSPSSIESTVPPAHVQIHSFSKTITESWQMPVYGLHCYEPHRKHQVEGGSSRVLQETKMPSDVSGLLSCFDVLIEPRARSAYQKSLTCKHSRRRPIRSSLRLPAKGKLGVSLRQRKRAEENSHLQPDA